MSKVPISPTAMRGDPREKSINPNATWSRDVYPGFNRMLNKGGEYADKGQYIGYGAGCSIGAALASETVFLMGVGCAAGTEVGGGAGYIIGGGVGLVVGFFKYY